MIDGGAIWLVAEALQYELMLFALAGFLLIGLDEPLLDLWWLLRATHRRFTIYRRYRRSTVADLRQPDKGPKFAIFLPAWKESSVIGQTLCRALRAYEGHNATLFVGCYPNDEATLRTAAGLDDEHVTIAVNRLEGPTTKADNLNSIWHCMTAHEDPRDPYDVVVLHDAEDHVDPAEALVFAALHQRFAMIQLPVEPFASPGKRWISGHYCDEFAEAHLKAMVVREAIGAGLPSAGVGCALRRDFLDKRDSAQPGLPFGADTLTEDYELGLAAKEIGMASAFVRIRDRAGGRLVATRAQFPHRLTGAVKQKSRWIAGISISGWDRVGWGNGLAELWMRFRDRKALVSAIVIVAGYTSLLIAALLYGLSTPALGQSLRLSDMPSALATMFVVTSSLLLWRMAARCACVAYTYDLSEGLRSVPRILVCNFITVCAAGRAVMTFIQMSRSGRVRWDKTEHYQE
jgi:bacteriophage N4 adsorption protein B